MSICIPYLIDVEMMNDIEMTFKYDKLYNKRKPEHNKIDI